MGSAGNTGRSDCVGTMGVMDARVDEPETDETDMRRPEEADDDGDGGYGAGR